MEKILKLSVHGLVDFLLRKGDIDNRIYNKNTMQEGSKVHAIYQAKQGENYLSEIYLKETFSVDDFEVTIDGRADGIILKENSATIDEIKSTVDDLKKFHEDQEEWHLGQAKCYALMYAHEHNLKKVGVKLTYISQTSDEKLYFYYSYKIEELEEYVSNLIHRYLNFYKFIYSRTERRNKSANELKFPYYRFRDKQKELSKYAYSIAKNGGILFCEAPTGIGKTISTLFPFVKSFALEKNEKIFYLTAKNSGKESAFKAVEDMKYKGLEATEISITAKEKICFNPTCSCNPDECPFAKDYYSKVQQIIIESIMNETTFNQFNIQSIALQNNICPFEFQLDLSLFVDIIICDYNYLFDPINHMQRYFDEDCSKYLVLVDEAHNLVERGRDMYSAFIDTKYFNIGRLQIKHIEDKKIKTPFSSVKKHLKAISELYNEGDAKITYLDSKFYNALERLRDALRELNKSYSLSMTPELKELSLEVNRFLKLSDYFDETYEMYINKYDKNDLKIVLYCLDASEKIRKSLDSVRGSVIFSATLSPIDYYVKMIGGSDKDPVLQLNSPFDLDKLKVMVAPTISTRYKKRDGTYQIIADYINEFVSSKLGNYFVFLPSYEYLNNILPLIELKDANIVVQESNMSDGDKGFFLDNFVTNPSKTTVGIVILGGSFGEGIDLIDDRLIGVVIVGVGLPQICFERDLIKQYFDRKSHNGFEYSYVNPGINKVTQAIGRVIRSEQDKGSVLLIDDRYLSKTYLPIFENRYKKYDVVTSKNEIIKILNEFWEN